MKKIIAKIVLICMVGMAILIGYFIYQNSVNMNALENIPWVEKMKADYKPKSTQPSKKATVSKKETSTTAPSTTATRERTKTTEELITITDATFTLDGDYIRFKAKVTNGSDRTVDYFKYDIFGANDKGDIVVCEWSNWSGTLPSGASTSIDTMFKYNPEGTRYGDIMNKISYAY